MNYLSALVHCEERVIRQNHQLFLNPRKIAKIYGRVYDVTFPGPSECEHYWPVLLSPFHFTVLQSIILISYSEQATQLAASIMY